MVSGRYRSDEYGFLNLSTCAYHFIPASGVSRKKRTDMYIYTLRSHIEAMGGQLEVIARFPDGAVKISNFAELGGPTQAAEGVQDFV